MSTVSAEVVAAAEDRLRDGVIEMTKAAQERGADPLAWTMQLSSRLSAAGVSMPSPEVARILVSHICWDNNVAIAWKFLEKALTIRVVPPMPVLALLSTRVIPNRKIYPAAYRLYMELLRRYAFSLPSLINGPDYHKTMDSVQHILKLDEIFGIPSTESGLIVVEFIFSIVWELLDASLDDDGLLELATEKKSRWQIRNQDIDIDCADGFEGKRAAFTKINTVMAIEIIGEFFQNIVTSRILYLARRNMPKHWECFIQNLRLLIDNSPSLRNSKNISADALLQLTSDTRILLSRECKTNSQQQFHAVTAQSPMSSTNHYNGIVRSALWLPLDIYLEDVMDGSQVRDTSAAEILSSLVKSLKAVNQTTWQDAFLGLWTSALCLVQRERNSSEGPVPRLDTCLCMLLSVATLAVANIIEEEEEVEDRKDSEIVGKCRQDLVSSLQRLDDFEGLLSPPPIVGSQANQAAANAMLFLSGVTIVPGHLDGISLNDLPSHCSGNLRHLIVEACIARNILDTSAYTWPGYVKGRCNQIPQIISGQMSGWSSFMSVSALTPSMVSALVSTPAASLAEIEKIYEFGVSGSDDDKIYAATILCGASLIRGWNIQEYTSLFITRMLSPPIPTDFSGSDNHLIGSAPFLNVLLAGISSIDSIQIFSLHGLVPQLAAALMPICETFGSCTPNMSWTLNGEQISSHAVFSNAMTLLLKLWRFDHPPLEHVMGDVTPVGSHLTPEYLLLVRNSQSSVPDISPKNQNRRRRLSRLSYPSSTEPIFMDSFPKLKRWYWQHQECLSSIFSGLVPGNSVHQIVEALLNMMFRKFNKVVGQSSTTTTTSGSNSSSVSGSDDLYVNLKLPAWDILEAVPFVLDASLTACAHGIISPRELTTGLKDLADFLPASLATIYSYFAAEVTRGLWKPAFMNGTDWPSPAANLSMVEEQIKKILEATGVNVPCLDIGANALTLPLPLAAIVSLTITYKLDKETDRLLNLVGPALSNLGITCPWPCMSIIAALWAQKVRRWSDFLVFAASQTVFHHNGDAIVQLLRVCFTAALGLHTSSVGSANGGVGALLGHGFGSHFEGGISAVAPGILYLKVHRAVRNVMFLTEKVVSILTDTVRLIAGNGLPAQTVDWLRRTKYSARYGHISLAGAMTQVKTAASLGASVVWISGGLNLVQLLIKETLPSWFISVHGADPTGQGSGGIAAMLVGYALAYFAVFSGLFAWGVDSASYSSKRRPKVLEKHLEFVGSALDGKISLGCNKATWKAYVTGYVSLMVSCTPKWMLEVDVEVLKRVSKGLKQWNEEELGLALLGVSGVGAMGAAAEMVVASGGF